MRWRYSDFIRGSYAVSAIDHLTGGLGETHLGLAVETKADAGRFAVGIGDGDVGQMDARLLGLDAALRVGLGWAGVALDQIEAGDEDSSLLGQHLAHLAGAALVLAGEQHDLVALLDLGGHHSTSGAREMIFMWFLARSSRGTGPKMRVPIGSDCLLTMTAAFLSKRITEPSLRLMAWLVRTTMACSTSPFFTRPRGIASLTETTIRSPTEA